MSKATEWMARTRAAEEATSDARSLRPVFAAGPFLSAEVDIDGELRLIINSGGPAKAVGLNPKSALDFATWILNTFGETK